MNKLVIASIFLSWLSTLFMLIQGEDPYLFFDWNVTYGTLSPLGVPQQVILINNEFPGPRINCSSNNNIVINVHNNLDEPLLFTWNGVQQRKNSWHEGVAGTNCPIPPGTNWTYHYQVKDQIGSYYYYPTTNLQRAAGGFGGIRINSRLLIPVPFPDPEDDYFVLAGDWYKDSHANLRNTLDEGKSIGPPDGILINGKTGSTDGKDLPMYTVKAGKTYRYRICNVGMKSSINFRIQGHAMKLVEVEGSHTIQNTYDSLDIHLGQCYSVLVIYDREPNDYYMVVSTRFLKNELKTTATIRYELGKQQPSSVLPAAPPPQWTWSLNQFRSIRWNLTASAARPNPQGSYHYGQINITRTIKLAGSSNLEPDGKLRFAINGVSHVNPDTPLKLAEYYKVADKVFKYDIVGDQPPPELPEKVTLAPIVLNATFRNFVEIILENRENSIQSWHLSGYAFFPVAIEAGRWSPDKRKNYNLNDAASKHTIQVYPNGWAAVMTTLDNAGMWNLRSNSLEREYLGQQLYFSVLSPANSLRDEYNIPDTAILCGIVKGMPMPPPYVV